MDKLDKAIEELTTIIREKSRTFITSHGAEDMLEWLKELKAYRETYPYGVAEYPPIKPAECDCCQKHICAGCEHYADKERWRKAVMDCPWK